MDREAAAQRDWLLDGTGGSDNEGSSSDGCGDVEAEE
jgi:hypothetical protein